jgi:demethylphylloquinone reductase
MTRPQNQKVKMTQVDSVTRLLGALAWVVAAMMIMISTTMLDDCILLGCDAFAVVGTITTSKKFTTAEVLGRGQVREYIPTINPTTTVLKATQYDRCDVAVFGGGFGGLYTALALAREDANKKNINNRKQIGGGGRRQGQFKSSSSKPLDIVLVDPGDRFVFLPLLYDLTMGTATEGEVCPTFEELLEGTRIRHVKASFDGFTTTNGPDDGKNSKSNFHSRLSTARLTPPTPKNGDLEGEEGVDEIQLSFDAAVVATGATPQSVLSSVPGADDYVQPFYTREDAWATRDKLFELDQKIRRGERPRVAVVGGGYGGVELAACLARRLPQAESVTLMTRGPPMKGTRAEPLVDQALRRLGVSVVTCSVDRIEPVVVESDEDGNKKIKSNSNRQQVRVFTSDLGGETSRNKDDDDTGEKGEVWDVVFWTAGSTPAYPVPDKIGSLGITSTGRLSIDSTLRCNWSSHDIASGAPTTKAPNVWALGDCAEIDSIEFQGPAVPRTAQAAIQQSNVVAKNVICALDNCEENVKSFQFQDLGTVLSLGGPLGAVVGPKDDSLLGPLFGTVLDAARLGLNVADELVSQALKSSPQAKKLGVTPLVENLGLSLGGYGLGVDPDAAPGTLAGTISGAARRAIYALRMPTNRQRAYAVASAAIASASSLAKEATEQLSRAEDEEG